MYSYYLNSAAKEDLRRLYYYGVITFGIIQADKYFNMMHDSFDKIELNPYLFPTAEHVKHGYRFCVSGVDTIYYKIEENNRIEIITIIGKQDFPK